MDGWTNRQNVHGTQPVATVTRFANGSTLLTTKLYVHLDGAASDERRK